MITVTPIQTKEEQARLCDLCHIPFETELLAYAAYDDSGALAGICQFKNDAAGGHLCHLAATDPADPHDCLFVLGRATLNFMDLCGIKHAAFEGEAPEALLRRIGFVADENGNFTVSLDGFFTHPCQHHSS